jgi:hypothetical protein
VAELRLGCGVDRLTDSKIEHGDDVLSCLFAPEEVRASDVWKQNKRGLKDLRRLWDCPDQLGTRGRALVWNTRR